MKSFDTLVEEVAAFPEDERPLLLSIQGEAGDRVACFYALEDFAKRHADRAYASMMSIQENTDAPCTVCGERFTVHVLDVEGAV